VCQRQLLFEMNVLIVKLSSLGDVVQTMPVIADILAAHPTAQIDWVVEEAFAPLVSRLEGVRRVIPIALRRWKKSIFASRTRLERGAFKESLRSETYDVVIDCQGLVKSALVARLAKITSTAGQSPYGFRGSFANKSEACGYEWPVKYLLPNNQQMPKRIHAIARTRLLASKLLGYEFSGHPQVAFKDLPMPSEMPNQIMFTHGTTRLDNEWPQWKWENLGALLAKHGKHQILLPHANDRELAICEGIKRHVGKSALILPRMGLPSLLDVMSTCQGVIGVDSGLSHMAVALGLPHVQIFSHDRAWRAGPVPISEGGLSHQLAVGGAQPPSVQVVAQAWALVTLGSAQ
jgi:heptosyltransferase I